MKNQPKDLFSKQSAGYRQYRPEYPGELYEHILQQVKGRESAWDCGTGNGQVAAALSAYFQEVDATDISENQLKNAIVKPNVYYKLCQSEKTNFDNDSFDLITVAQAIHWFNFEAFYAEVKRVAKPNAILAVWGYGLFRIHAEIDALIDEFYTQVVGPYWDSERRHIDEEYKNIPFPFAEVGESRRFYIYRHWHLADLQGFLNTWSSIQNYIQQRGENPIGALLQKIQPLWPANEPLQVRFPVFLRMGKVK